MKLYISNKLAPGLVEAVEKLCSEHHVVCKPLPTGSGGAVLGDDDVVVCDESDTWLKIKKAVLLIVVADHFPEKIKAQKLSPLFYPKAALQLESGRACFVGQIEKILTAQWVLRSNAQEIHARIQEVIHDLQNQLRIVRILFRNALRKSFPQHEYIEASYQYMDQPESKLVHYSDYFGDASSRKLWVLGSVTPTYSQSADLIELIQELAPNPSEMAVTDFMHVWEKRLKQINSIHAHEVMWIWTCFDFQAAVVSLCANRVNDGFVWMYSPKGIRVLECSAAGNHLVHHPLSHEQVVFWVMGFMDQSQARTPNITALKDIELMYAALDLSSQTALSHLHDQFLQYCNDHQLLKNGGPSMLFRLRPNTFRVVCP